MAIDYTTNPNYTGKIITTDPNYPQGKFQDETTPGISSDGTPQIAIGVNDLNGFLQALLLAGSITPSGTADNANTSDYLNALKAIFMEKFTPNTGFNKNFGTAAGTVAQGNDARFNSTDQKAGLDASPTSITASNPVASIADLTILGAGRLLSTRTIQGSVNSVSDTTPGYIDSTSLKEATAGINSAIYDSNAGGVVSNWGNILPITVPGNVGMTSITGWQFATLAGGGGQDEDIMLIDLTIDWANAKIFGMCADSVGTGYAYQAHFSFYGSIATGTNDFVATLYNGNYAGSGDAPTFRIDGTNKKIDRLPMLGGYRNVTFTIKNYS